MSFIEFKHIGKKYAGAEHKHEAQSPKMIDINSYK